MTALQALIQRRESVQSTQKMMSAMKIVAATKLKKLMIQRSASQGCVERFAQHVIPAFWSDIDLMQNPDYKPSFLADTSSKAKGQTLWVVLGANRGLCGHFNAQIVRMVTSAINRGAKKNLREQTLMCACFVGGKRRPWPCCVVCRGIMQPNPSLRRPIWRPCRRWWMDGGQISLLVV